MMQFEIDGYGDDRPFAHHLEEMQSLGIVIPDGKLYSWTKFSAPIEVIAKLSFKVTLEPGEFGVPVINNLMSEIHQLKLKIDQMANTPQVNTFNEKCTVHVPGLGLLLINEVKVENDRCTDAINEMLQDGWRIVAVCPQPDQRRPDYVLGRTNIIS